MTEVRRHKRKTASGKTVTVRHHTRDVDAAGQDAGEQAREAWAERFAAPHVSTLRPAEPAAQAEEWWAGDDEPAAGDFWADDEPSPSAAFLSMQENMREWRARPEPDVTGAVPDTSPLGRLLGNDTQEGAENFARLKAYREAGYDGPLDSQSRIPDPDDPAERRTLELLAALRETHG